MHTKFQSENLKGRDYFVGIEGNINMDLEGVGCKSVDWIHRTQDCPVIGFCEHGNVCFCPIDRKSSN
jgi:hypothetical protein